VAVGANDGEMLWTYKGGNEQNVGGNFQLVLREDGLYAMGGRIDNSYIFDPMTGKIVTEFQMPRQACTRATGAADAVFVRGAGTLRIGTDKHDAMRIPAMRPACQDGVIISNGQLYWGPWMCDCNHTLVGVISLGPADGYDFAQKATGAERLWTNAKVDRVEDFRVDEKDWPTYRANNTRSGSAPVTIAPTAKLLWHTEPSGTFEPTAPVAAGGMIFTGGSDGVVRAMDAATGQTLWKCYTGGAVRYPPTVANGRVYVGSYDGYVYVYSAEKGRLLWRFRAAPEERTIPVYGKLASTWPVASGVMVEDGVAYFGAGIASHDGTHVYALDAETGEVLWQNNTSGRLMDKDRVSGVSVQGHMLMHDGKVYMAGGNVVSPGIYDAQSGECLNTLTNEWQRVPRGSELFLVNNKVTIADRMLYSPRAYIPGRNDPKFVVQAWRNDSVIRGTENAIVCYDNPIPFPPGAATPQRRTDAPRAPIPQPQARWRSSHLSRTDAVVFADNAMIVAGAVPDKNDETKVTPALLAYDPADGSTHWAVELPVQVAPWGLCLDREGRVVVTLSDGRVLCFAGDEG
jgi:outer membrane protein assembly factor BamB